MLFWTNIEGGTLIFFEHIRLPQTRRNDSFFDNFDHCDSPEYLR
jgi:hypothetical protein